MWGKCGFFNAYHRIKVAVDPKDTGDLENERGICGINIEIQYCLRGHEEGNIRFERLQRSWPCWHGIKTVDRNREASGGEGKRWNYHPGTERKRAIYLSQKKCDVLLKSVLLNDWLGTFNLLSSLKTIIILCLGMFVDEKDQPQHKATILCPLCGLKFTPDSSNICPACTIASIESENILKAGEEQLICSYCQRYERPPWVNCNR